MCMYVCGVCASGVEVICFGHPPPQYEDGDGEEWEDATPHSLESLLGVPGYVGYEYNEEEEDPDLKDEAILKIDMEVLHIMCGTC